MTRLFGGGVLAVGLAAFAAGCSDDISFDPDVDIDDPFATGGSTTLPDPTTTSTTDPTTTSTTGDPSTSSGSTTTAGSSSTGDGTTDGTSTGDATTGGIIPSDYEPMRGQLVNSGRRASSTNYTMVYTMGQPTAAQSTHASSNYRLQGGLVGANGSPP